MTATIETIAAIMELLDPLPGPSIYVLTTLIVVEFIMLYTVGLVLVDILGNTVPLLGLYVGSIITRGFTMGLLAFEVENVLTETVYEFVALDDALATVTCTFKIGAPRSMDLDVN